MASSIDIIIHKCNKFIVSDRFIVSLICLLILITIFLLITVYQFVTGYQPQILAYISSTTPTKTSKNTYVLPKINFTVNWSDPMESCSLIVREKYKLNIPDSYPNQWRHDYKFSKIPKRTFTFWLSHIENKRRLKDKAYFSDKYLMKEYIENYIKVENGIFSYINYAHILFDEVSYTKKQPSFQQIIELKNKYDAFLVKPNHYCGRQIIIGKNDNITYKKYEKILNFSRKYVSRLYARPLHLEDHYLYIKPHIFIEEHLNIEHSNEQNDHLNVDSDGNLVDDMIEYKIMVINYKCIFLYVIKKPYKNLYSALNFTLLDARWGTSNNFKLNIRAPSGDNLEKMVKFSQHFAEREKFKFVRVDLYEIRNKIYFSEFTFTPMMGIAKLVPADLDYYLYDLICNASQENLDKIYQFAVK